MKESQDTVTAKLLEQKLAEQTALVSKLQYELSELRKNEIRHHKMITEIQDYAIIFLDKEGIIRNWNKGAEKIKLYKEEEIIGKHFSIFYLPEDLEQKLPNRLLQEAADNGSATHEGWRRRKDGTKFWGSVTITSLHDPDNEIIGYSKVTRDLTDRKVSDDHQKQITQQLRSSNEELKLSEERYHQMIAEVRDYAIISLDINGNIQNWNAGAQVIKGYSDEVIGRNFSIFYTSEDKERNLPAYLLETAEKNGRATHEGWRVRKDGSKFWGSIVITALHDKKGKLIGFSKVTRDLTDRKIAEDRLVAYTAELELQNNELEQFAYVASHDLQEPLRKIRIFTDLLKRSLPNDEAVMRYFEKIDNSSVRMSELIKSVLNYSRLSKDEAELADVDLNEVVRNIEIDFELLIEEKNATILKEDLPTVKGYRLQLGQLFANLISNSLKFNNKEPVITIRSRVVKKDQIINQPTHLYDVDYNEIVVADNGIGFDQQYETLIFSMFQRLHGKQQYSGTGIGLALCKKIVENHSGYIAARGELGKGSTFYIYLPVAKQ